MKLVEFDRELLLNLPLNRFLELYLIRTSLLLGVGWPYKHPFLRCHDPVERMRHAELERDAAPVPVDGP